MADSLELELELELELKLDSAFVLERAIRADARPDANANENTIDR